LHSGCFQHFDLLPPNTDCDAQEKATGAPVEGGPVGAAEVGAFVAVHLNLRPTLILRQAGSLWHLDLVPNLVDSFSHLSSVGAEVVGDSVGASVGFAVGLSVGELVGATVGSAVGDSVGYAVGYCVGALVGATVGSDVGESVGATVGAMVGAEVLIKSFCCALHLKGT